LSQRAQEAIRQTDLIQQAWTDSGKVYGYRKLHDDLLDQGYICSESRVVRLASLVGIAAQIGYKRRPGRSDGKPASQRSSRTTHWIDSSRWRRLTVFG
jgi:putative transposase